MSIQYIGKLHEITAVCCGIENLGETDDIAPEKAPLVSGARDR